MAIILASKARAARQVAIAPPAPETLLPPRPRAVLKAQADEILAADKRAQKKGKGKEAYQFEMDVLHFAAPPVPLGDKARIEVNVMSYDGGPKKLQLIKAGTTKDWKSTSIPRLTPEEARALLTSIDIALAWMSAS